MKPGDRIIWLRSPGRSFMTGWRIQAIPAEIVQVSKYRIKIRVRQSGQEKLVYVDPDNVICEGAFDNL